MARNELTIELSFLWWFKYAVYALALLHFGRPMNERALDFLIRKGVKCQTINP